MFVPVSILMRNISFWNTVKVEEIVLKDPHYKNIAYFDGCNRNKSSTNVHEIPEKNHKLSNDKVHWLREDCSLSFVLSSFQGLKVLKGKKNLASSHLKRTLLMVQAEALLDGASLSQAEEALQIFEKVSVQTISSFWILCQARKLSGFSVILGFFSWVDSRLGIVL